MSRYFSKVMPSPVGPLTLVASDNGVAAVLWNNETAGRVRLGESRREEDHPLLLHAQQQLGEYFAGQRAEFSLPLDCTGTDFQRCVWSALRTIPYGETRSYLDIARQIGSPDAVRAVGAANGRNPVAIITPCHRVVGSTGKLTGFAAGLEIKAWLLAMEGRGPLRLRASPNETALRSLCC